MIRRKRDNVNYQKEYNIVVRIISGLFYGTYLIAYIILSIPIYFFFVGYLFKIKKKGE